MLKSGIKLSLVRWVHRGGRSSLPVVIKWRGTQLSWKCRLGLGGRIKAHLWLNPVYHASRGSSTGPCVAQEEQGWGLGVVVHSALATGLQLKGNPQISRKRSKRKLGLSSFG